MFGKGMHLSMFYCLCYVKDISTYMSEEQVSEQRDPDLNEEEDIRMEDSREEHWRYVDQDGDDKNNIRTLMWDVYIKEEEELIHSQFQRIS